MRNGFLHAVHNIITPLHDDAPDDDDDNDDGDGDEGEKVEVTFQDGSTRTFDKGVPMRQIWHEYTD